MTELSTTDQALAENAYCPDDDTAQTAARWAWLHAQEAAAWPLLTLHQHDIAPASTGVGNASDIAAVIDGRTTEANTANLIDVTSGTEFSNIGTASFESNTTPTGMVSSTISAAVAYGIDYRARTPNSDGTYQYWNPASYNTSYGYVDPSPYINAPDIASSSYNGSNYRFAMEYIGALMSVMSRPRQAD